jgi:uncharacterized protein YdiU (UPF0061 family)
MEAYQPRMVFSSIDRGGRYAYANQPGIAQWNMARLAEALLALIDADQERAIVRATELIDGFAAQYRAEWLAVMRAKLGLAAAEKEDQALIEALLEAMDAGRADFTLSFRRLGACAQSPAADAQLLELFDDGEAITAWLARWRERLALEARPAAAVAERMRAVNPLYIPRNHLIEQAIAAAIEKDDLAPFKALQTVLARPFEEQPDRERYSRPAAADEQVLRTFCGT